MRKKPSGGRSSIKGASTNTSAPGFQRALATQERERPQPRQHFVARTIEAAFHLRHMLVVAYHLALGLQPLADLARADIVDRQPQGHGAAFERVPHRGAHRSEERR